MGSLLDTKPELWLEERLKLATSEEAGNAATSFFQNPPAVQEFWVMFFNFGGDKIGRLTEFTENTGEVHAGDLKFKLLKCKLSKLR